MRVNSVEVTDATWGFHFGEADGRSIDVRDCEMNDVFYGIEAIGSVGYVALLHNNNILGYNMDFANFPPFISNSHFPIGVIIDNAAVTTNPVNIEEQQVTIQGANGIGIRVDNGGWSHSVLKNTVNFTSTALTPGTTPASLPLWGYSFQGSEGCAVKGNDAFGNFTTYTVGAARDNVAGMYMFDSRDLELVCNDLRETRHGFQVVGDCTTPPDFHPPQ